MIMVSTNSSSSLTFSKQTYKLPIITHTADGADAILQDDVNKIIYLGNIHPSDVLVSLYCLPNIYNFMWYIYVILLDASLWVLQYNYINA